MFSRHFRQPVPDIRKHIDLEQRPRGKRSTAYDCRLNVGSVARLRTFERPCGGIDDPPRFLVLVDDPATTSVDHAMKPYAKVSCSCVRSVVWLLCFEEQLYVVEKRSILLKL